MSNKNISIILLFIGLSFGMLLPPLGFICCVASMYFITKHSKELRLKEKENDNEK